MTNKNIFNLYIFILKLFAILTLFYGSAYAQNYEYYGIKLGYSPSVKGWSDNPFDENYYYNHLRDEPKIDNLFFGFNFEFSRSKVFSTLFELDYKIRSYKFNLDTYNEFGQLTGSKSISGEITYLSFSVTEKFRYNPSLFSLYAFAGLRTDIYINKSGYISLLKQKSDMNSLMFGLNSGVGIAYGKKHRFSLEFYFKPDLTKHYSSSSGTIRYLDFGLSLGYGIVISRK